MAKYQNQWDPMRDRRTSEAKLFKESYMFGNTINSPKRYIISKEWFETWMSFLYAQSDECPGQIDNNLLSSRIQLEGLQSMQKNIDYFEFPQQTWNSLWEIYRGGPALVIRHNCKVEIEDLCGGKSEESESHVVIVNSKKAIQFDFDSESHRGLLNGVSTLEVQSESIRPVK